MSKQVSKTKCQKLRQDKDGKLYKVKTYHYDNRSKLERAKRKEQKESKRLQELPNIELVNSKSHVSFSYKLMDACGIERFYVNPISIFQAKTPKTQTMSVIIANSFN